MATVAKPTVYVVTGGNRGIGLGLVKGLLSRPSTTVIATVRNNASATSLKQDISATVKIGDQSNLEIVELDLTAAPSAGKVEEIFSRLGYDHIDVLVNNAGVSPPMFTAAQTPAEDLRVAFEVNTIAPQPKVIMMSSSVGCITFQELSGGSYGPSKAALNWITRALHLQNEEAGLVAVALHPGWVQTRMGEKSAKDWEYPHPPPETVDNSVKGVLEVIDGATRDTVAGKFVTYQGQVLPW
ncbi:short chain dehydrogenase domain-containing protein [Pochonia chlamydosporia 170]|uniref:Short chain dehydrogenase domain-containing protein n=1 Tax=Pochonia chlamydosporia 170 TaxID=1380566 RepID=A0A179F1R1_METCM|nr:short chain dehydrogenase domain-containing protein [Pochonia chlamydosporia 170]OAQ59368.1 short chain dehydrogenase domain-containing protein [Pochonia chlamydosporia 170]